MKRIKVNIQQPSIPTYRKDFFEKLNNFVSLRIFYGSEKEVPSEFPINVALKYYKLYNLRIGKFQIKWHNAQIAAVSKDTDVVILSWDVQYLTLWLAILKAKIIKKPLILWGHGYSKNDSKIKTKIRNFCAALADSVIVYDHITANKLSKILNNKVKIFTAPNSLNYEKIKIAKEKFLFDQEALNKFRNKHRLTDSYNLIYIGRIYKENKVEILINALAEISKTHNNIKLIFIGDDKNSYAKQLKHLASALNIDKKIIWVGALYNEEAIAPWMLSSKIFCYPENVGLSLIHAFGYGLPAIIGDSIHKHNPESFALIPNTNGFFFKSQNYLHLAERIMELYKNETLRKYFSIKALRIIETEFNLDKMIFGFLLAINYTVCDESNTYNIFNG